MLLFAALSVLCAPATTSPHLAVIVIFDQMRATDLDRLQPLFGAGGFGGFTQGASYDAFYDYASTETGPGHATMATCANPNVHGVVANRWYDEGHWDRPMEASNPEALHVGTLGDAWRGESSGASKVVTISAKDRAAMLSAGHSANAAIWFDPKQKRYVAASGKLPVWAEPLAVPVALTHSVPWTPLATPPTLAGLIPADANPHEGGFLGLSDRFPHDLATMSEADRAEGYRGSPESVHDLFALALAAVEGEKLGKGPHPDLLIVSISATDYVQHTFGPTSAEAADMLRRADRELRAFRATLAQKVGPVVMAVAADHGGSPIPENITALGIPAGRIEIKPLLDHLRTEIGKVAPNVKVLGLTPPHLNLLIDASADRAKVLATARAVLLATPGIAAVYDPAAPPTNDPFDTFYRHSMFPGRSGALLVRQAPHFMFAGDASARGSDHGSPYTYDRRVRFIIDGPGVRPGHYAAPVDVRDISPTVAFLLRAPLPDACQGHPVSAVGP